MTKRIFLLNPASIPGLPAGEHNDGGGLTLVVKKGGARSWVGRYYQGGNTYPRGLGPWPEVGLSAARDRHAAMRQDFTPDVATPEPEIAPVLAGKSFAEVAEKVIAIALTSPRRHP